MSARAHIEYWPPQTTDAETAALKWLAGYRHGTVSKRRLDGYYEQRGSRGSAQAAGRMWRALVGKLLVDQDARALTPAGLAIVNR